MKKTLETIVYLSIAGLGISGIMPDKLGIKPYNKKYEIDSIYRLKQDSLYTDYLIKRDNLEKWYFAQFQINSK